MQCDELWSFADNKGNKQWVWLALDADTRELVGVYIGARNEVAARQLWNSLAPPRAPMRRCLHRFLGSLRHSAAKKTTSSRRQGNGFSPVTLNDSTTPSDSGCLG
jgi:IS1 family transposase